MATTNLDRFQQTEATIKSIIFQVDLWIEMKKLHRDPKDFDLKNLIKSIEMIELIPLMVNFPDDISIEEAEFYSNNLKKCLEISEKYKSFMAVITAGGKAPEIANVLEVEQPDKKEMTRNLLLVGKKAADTAAEFDDVMKILAQKYQPKVGENEEVVYSE